MNIKVNYFENDINIYENQINAIEIENKKYFYRFVNDLIKIENGNYCDDITITNEYNKIKVLINFFNFSFDSKKYVNDINKYINDYYINEENQRNLIQIYKKIVKEYNKILNDIELPLLVGNDINIESITKFIKIKIEEKTELLDNLLLLIDLEKTLKTDNILFFINVKQFLKIDELIELYKYAIYNQIKIILIDSQSYGGTIEYERKNIIDENLDEFVI